jgi:glycosyltransferase involved in cell wall biosynthesis
MVLERDFPPDLRVENEIKSLLKLGHEVFLACYTFKREFIEETWNGCRVFKKPISSFTYKSSVGALRLPFYFRFWRNFVSRVCKEIQAEAIHIHDLPLALIGIQMKEKFGLKCVLDFHENWPAFLRISRHTNSFLGKLLSSNALWEDYELLACKRADHIIVVIGEASDRLVHMGISKSKITILANYPVLADFNEITRKKTSPGNGIQMIYAGGITEHRGLQYVIAALPDIIKIFPDLTLKILGEGNYRASLEKLCGELGVHRSVIFTGQVSYARVLKELGMADVAIIPHIKSDHTDSTIPHKIFQYMYSGIPVIASNCKPLERILKDENTGYIYSWNSPESFAEKLSLLLNRHGETAEMQERARLAVKKRYNWESQEILLSNLYNQLN